MNRTLRLALLVVGILAFGGLAAAGWFFLAAPYLARVKEVDTAEAAARSAESARDGIAADARKLEKVARLSLPAGPLYTDDSKRTKREYADVARSEYEQALVKVLKDAGARNSTVNFSDTESTNKMGIPQIDPAFKANRDSEPTEYLAYTPIVFKIDIPRADLATVAEVLRRYYSLDLLHQITHLNIKQAGSSDLGDDKRSQKERSDLKVEITTRAIIVNGAARRRTLTPAPNSVVGLVGGIGGASYEQNPGVGRKVLPEPFEAILANAPIREYQYLAAKDVYHGTLPEIKPIDPPKGPTAPTAVEVPKPDFREYIWFTTSIHTSRGDEHTVEITIKDKINQDEYQVVVTQEGEKVSARTTKYEFDNFKVDVSQRKKKVVGYDSKRLDISRWTMINKNDFVIYGVDTDGSLVLGEKPSGLAPELPKDDKKPVVGGFGAGAGAGFGGGGQGGGARPSSKTTLPPPDPKASVIGGMVVTAPKAEKFYRWESGKSLKQIVELSKPDAEKAIKRAQTRFLPTPAATTTPAPPPPELKVTDKP